MSSNSGQEAIAIQNYPKFQLLRVRIGRELGHRSQNAFAGIRGYSILGKNLAGTSYGSFAFKGFPFLSVSFTCRLVPLNSSRIDSGYDLQKLKNADSKKWNPRIKYYKVFICPELMC